MPILELSNLEISYGSIKAVRGVSLTVEQGEIVSIIGANGAGKSTILKAVVGSGKVTGGSILLKGVDIVNQPSHKIASTGVAFVPENKGLFPGMSVLDNLQMGAYLQRNKNLLEESFQTVCSLFPVLERRLKQSAGTLSGGEQQMLSISRALMSRPQLLLMDEPTLGLSPKLTQEIFARIKEINSLGTTILLCEQNARMTLKISGRVYVMETGKITLQGRAEELMGDPEVQRSYLGKTQKRA